MVVLHTTEGSYRSAVRWFLSEASRVSAHYLIGLDGRVAQFVDEADTARHAGRVRNPTAPLIPGANPNLYTIGIELEDGGDAAGVVRPDAQYATAGQLLRQVADRWEIPLDRRHVVGHREIFDAKTCPGNLDIDRVIAEASGA